MTYAEQLREYNIALSINEATRMKDAKARLKKYFDRLREDKFTDVDRKLKQLYLNACDALDVWLSEHGEPLNPKLVKIQEILLELNTNNKDAKGILFSKTRETTVALENWIKENDVLKMMLKPLRLVGSNDREGKCMFTAVFRMVVMTSCLFYRSASWYQDGGRLTNLREGL